ncbi:terminase large subunit [Ruegeria halocynthiae]|uniref:terminase large subunit n=1 Tax=Ruegeria halocynthiae TaxID=985054 RepID=UPI0005632770|nr:terminase TerL endonuclease subunit [Ruegeria halocynthiae]
MAKKSTYPHWLFDSSEIPDPLGHGERAVRFLRGLRHPKSTEPKQKIKWAEWQERIVRRIYGPVDEDGERLVREVFLMIPRGNRKTSLAAALSILHLLGPQKLPGGQIIFAAADRSQAATGFEEAAELVRYQKSLERSATIYDPSNAPKSIKSKIDSSRLKAVSSDGKNVHGTTPTFVLADEIHVWRNKAGREMWEAIKSGMSKRIGGLTVVATTAGRGREGLAAERYEYARKVALGEIDNPAFLPIIFEPEEGDDWLDEEVWHKLNPGFKDGFCDLKGIRAEALEAQQNSSKRFEFQQYRLNVWHANSREPLFDFDTYDECCFPDEETDLLGLPCYLGVDYAQSGDLAAVVAAWRFPDKRIAIKPWFFVAGERLQEREQLEGLPYQRWIDDGYITACDGPVIPQQDVQDLIEKLCADYSVEEVAYDPWKFRVAAMELHDKGLPMIEMRQGPATMAPATGEFVRTVNGRVIRHDGNPVLRNHFANVAAVTGDTGKITMFKADPKHDHIDGAFAAVMAVSRAVAAESNKSKYNDPNYKTLSDILEEAA